MMGKNWTYIIDDSIVPGQERLKSWFHWMRTVSSIFSSDNRLLLRAAWHINKFWIGRIFFARPYSDRIGTIELVECFISELSCNNKT